MSITWMSVKPERARFFKISQPRPPAPLLGGDGDKHKGVRSFTPEEGEPYITLFFFFSRLNQLPVKRVAVRTESCNHSEGPLSGPRRCSLHL